MPRQPLSKAILARLEQALRRRGWDYERLAERAGCNVKTVRRTFGGDTFSLSRLDQFAELLGVDLADTPCPDTPQDASTSRKILYSQPEAIPRPVIGWKAAASVLGIDEDTLWRHRNALGSRKRKPWWPSVEALQFWYDGLTTEPQAVGEQ